MKKRKLKLAKSTVIALIFSSIAFIACNDSSFEDDNKSAVLDEISAKTQSEIDDVSEELNAMVEDVYYNEINPTANKDEVSKNKFLPECVTITKVLTGNTKKVTIDYGDGCTTKNDNFVKGKVIALFTFDIPNLSMNIDYSFENFYFNGKKIEGEINKVRIKINDKGHAQATINRDIKITWEDGSYVTVKGERVREMIEGFENDAWGDDVFSITGKWTITFKNGLERTSTIVEPLIRKMACRFIVQGKVEIKSGDRQIMLNYGNGDCDDLAIATVNGKEHEINLSTHRKGNED
jgi:hypothetical protein